MKQLKTKPWFIILLVVFFILHGTVENFGFIYAVEVIKIAVAILCCAIAFYFIIKFFVKGAVQAALICFFITTWILFFGAIFDWVKGIHFLNWLHSYKIFIPFMLSTVVFFMLFIRNKKGLQLKLCFYLNVLLLIYCGYDLAALVVKSLQNKKQTSASAVAFDVSAVKAKPNVYFLVFDEYPGYKSLQDSFAFSNDSLYRFLEAKQFKLLPAFSNYNMTFYSMASMLNMEYIDQSSYQPLQNTMNDDQTRIKEIENALAIRYFVSMGYSFTNYSIFDILDKPSVKGNSFVISQATLITHKIFFNRLLNDLGWNFIRGKYRVPFIENIYKHEDRNNQFIENEIMEIEPQKLSSPMFMYAHFNMPHPLIFRDSAGNYLSNTKMFDPLTYYDKTAFLSYLKYTNKKIEEMTDVICKRDSNAIVIVMSDHGYRGYNSTSINQPLQFDNICAVRFPDKNYLPFRGKWSTVNFFRYLFNCEFNQKMPYLNDSTIFLKDKKTG
jgi:hypothetical protein